MCSTVRCGFYKGAALENGYGVVPVNGLLAGLNGWTKHVGRVQRAVADAYLKDVLTRLSMHMNGRVEELLPHRWSPAWCCVSVIFKWIHNC